MPVFVASVAIPAKAAVSGCTNLRDQYITLQAKTDGTLAREQYPIPDFDRLKEIEYTVVGGGGRGAGGGSGLGTPGRGAYIQGKIVKALVPTASLWLIAGEMGQALRGGTGYGYGGAAETAAGSGESGGAGGGGSALFFANSSEPIVVAGGGGGGGGGQVQGSTPWAGSLEPYPAPNNLNGNAGLANQPGNQGSSAQLTIPGYAATASVGGGRGGGLDEPGGPGGSGTSGRPWEKYAPGAAGNGRNGARGAAVSHDGRAYHYGGGGGGGYQGGGSGMAGAAPSRWNGTTPSGTRVYMGSGGGGGSSFIDTTRIAPPTTQTATNTGNGYVRVRFIYEPC
ncbi:MAG: hypothetical protein WA971_12940 [Microbacterium sp.]